MKRKPKRKSFLEQVQEWKELPPAPKPKRKPRRLYVVECKCQNWVNAYRHMGDATNDAQNHWSSRCRGIRVVTFEEVLPQRAR